MEAQARTFRLVGTAEEIPVIEALLREQGFDFESEPFHPLARRLTAEPQPLGTSLAARFGRLYIQDRSSMLPPLALAPEPGSSALDMCAAPGSKTGMLSGLVGKDGFVLACEPGERIGTLRANLQRTGCLNTATVRSLAQNLPLQPGTWDAIQLDPPCSGWGTINKDPKVRERWTPERLGPLMSLQRELLTKACTLLRPGGKLVYSTCTTHEGENEQQTLWALENLPLKQTRLAPLPQFVLDTPAQGVSGVWRVADESEGQGFYVAAFSHTGPIAAPTPTLSGKNEKKGFSLATLKGAEDIDFSTLTKGKAVEFKGRIFWVPSAASASIPDTLPWQGCPLGRIGGQGKNMKFKPDATMWALLPEKRSASGIEASTQDLLRLLCGQALPSSGKGTVSGLYWNGLRLGWLSRKGNRLLWQERQ